MQTKLAQLLPPETKSAIQKISVWRNVLGNLRLEGAPAVIASQIPYCTRDGGFCVGVKDETKREKIIAEMNDFARANQARIYFVFNNDKPTYAYVGKPMPGFEKLGEAPTESFEAFKKT